MGLGCLNGGSFEATFTVEPTFSDGASAHSLTFDAIDTYANISLNGANLGTASNAFRTWSFKVPPGLLRTSGGAQNKLEVAFAPPIGVATERARAFRAAEGVSTCKQTVANQTCPVPASIYYNDYAEPTNRNFVRKPPYDFGWDWGPVFAPTGILGNVTLSAAAPSRKVATDVAEAVASDGMRIEQQWHANGSVTLLVSLATWAEPAAIIRSASRSNGERSARMEVAEEEGSVEIRAILCYPSCPAGGGRMASSARAARVLAVAKAMATRGRGSGGGHPLVGRRALAGQRPGRHRRSKGGPRAADPRAVAAPVVARGLRCATSLRAARPPLWRPARRSARRCRHRPERAPHRAARGAPRPGACAATVARPARGRASSFGSMALTSSRAAPT